MNSYLYTNICASLLDDKIMEKRIHVTLEKKKSQNEPKTYMTDFFFLKKIRWIQQKIKIKIKMNRKHI